MDSDAEIPNSAALIETLKVGGMFTGLIILAITWFIVRLITGALERTGARFVHRRLFLNQIATLVRFLFYIGGIAAAVGASINLSRDVILALTGTVALTIGFALKDLASSILAGLTIIVDRPFQVGDRVKFEDYSGEIISIGLRSVRLLTSDDSIVTVPNNKFLTESVVSSNHGNLDMMITLEFFVAADQDISLAKRIVEECMTSNRFVFLGKPWIVVVNLVMCDTGVAVRLQAKAHVVDVKYDDQYTTDVTERVLEAFRHKGIALPGEAAAPEPSPSSEPHLAVA